MSVRHTHKKIRGSLYKKKNKNTLFMKYFVTEMLQKSLQKSLQNFVTTVVKNFFTEIFRFFVIRPPTC